MTHEAQGTGRRRGAITRWVRLLPALLAAAVIAVVASGAHPVRGAAFFQVCIAFDGSGSITADQFTTEKEGIIFALEDVMPLDGSVEFSAVMFGFGTSGVSQVVVPRTIMADQDAKNTAVLAVQNLTQPEGRTNIQHAVVSCTNLITKSDKFDGALLREINLSSDGQANEGNTEAAKVRDVAVAAGIDFLDAEFINNDEDENTLGHDYMEDFVWPQPAEHIDCFDPCDVENQPPIPTGETGFVYHICCFAGYAAAMVVKFGVITEPRGGPVGGIVNEIPDSVRDQLEPADSSGASVGVLAGAIGGAFFVSALALSGGAWYLRRRRLG